MKATLIIFAIALGGCAQTQGLRTDLSAKPITTGQEEQALIRNLMVAYKDCSPNISCAVFKVAPDMAEVKSFVEAGMTLSDYYCDSFFRQTNVAARKRRFTRNATNDVGGVISAILGLAKAGSGVTGGIAAGFSFADSGFRNYDESFMVDAELSKLRRLVLSAQDNMKKAIFSSPPSSYFSAESTIIRYSGLCSFLGMQDLLNDAVAEKTTRIEAATGNPVSAEKIGRDGTGITPVQETTPSKTGVGATAPTVSGQSGLGVTSQPTLTTAPTDAEAAAAATISMSVAPPPPPTSQNPK